jgi:acetylornithine deacetylase
LKGFLACALRAACLAAGRRLTRPLHLALSYDEELGCLGVRGLLDRLVADGLRPGYCIVGEPTGMAVMTGHKGKIAARAVCCGTAAHSALAPRALNAIHLATDFVGAVRRRQALLAEAVGDPAYDVPYTTLHVGAIAGGMALNIVPDRCVVNFEIRNIFTDDAASILAAVERDAAALVAAARDRFPTADIAIEVTNDYPGLDTPPDAPVVAFARGLTDVAAMGKVAFGTEAGLFQARLGVACVVCGPGSMEQGHKPDEFVTRAQLAACDRMMEGLLATLAG